MEILKKIGIVCLVLVLGAFTNENISVADGYGIGDKAADFTLENIDGSMVSLSDYKNAKGFLVIFTCNTCPYAKAYEDRIIALNNKYKPLNVPVIAINPNNPEIQPGDGFEDMKARARQKGFTFPYLFDEGQKVFPQYGATRTPHVFLLEKMSDGNYVRYIGAIDDNSNDASNVDEKYVEMAIDAMLAGEEIEKSTTRAIGCGIKA